MLPTNAIQIITCVSLPPATISSVPIYDFAEANEELVDEHMWKYIIHVAERAFVEAVFAPSMSLETMTSVHFVKQRERAKQMKKKLKD